VAVRVARLALGGRAEHRGDVVEALDVGLLREIEVAAVGLALTGERGLQILFGLRALELHGIVLSPGRRRFASDGGGTWVGLLPLSGSQEKYRRLPAPW